MALSGVESVLVDLVVLFALAGTVAAFAARVARIPYTIALLLLGLAVSVLGVNFRTELPPELLSELILAVLVPGLVFEGASRVDVDAFVENVGQILVLAVVGLLGSVVVLGLASTVAFGFPLVVALLFAAIVLPTDPVAVLPIFEDLGAPERLSVLIDGESMLNDGVGVVLYSSFLAIALEELEGGGSQGILVALGRLTLEIGGGIVLAMGGGLVVGILAGSIVVRVAATFDDPMTTVLLSFVLAYGSFLIGEALGVSGVIAVVASGLFVAYRSENPVLNPTTRQAFRTTWASIAFVANTFLFMIVGVVTPFSELVSQAGVITVTVVLVFLARAVVVYPLAMVLNRLPLDPIPRSYQHVLVWSGIHVSIPLALVLGLPPEFPAPLAEQLRAMVFGVAGVTLVVQGLSMKPVVERLGLVESSTA